MFDSSTYLTLKSSEVPPGGDWSMPADGLLFLHVQRGQAAFCQGFSSHALGTGDILVANSPNQIRIRAANGETISFRWFLTRVEQLYALFDNSEIFLLQKIAEGYRNAKRYPTGTRPNTECLQLLEEVKTESGLNQRGHLLRVITAVLATEMDATAHSGGTPDPSATDHFVRVLQQLSAEELISSSVGELARRFGCGRRHLNRLFHRHVGVSVAALRMEMRLLKAIALLRDPEAKIIHIASQCGFNHLGLFNTCFKRRFGMSPGLWRKSGNETSKPDPNAVVAPMGLSDLTHPKPSGGSGSTGEQSAATTPQFIGPPTGANTHDPSNPAANLVQLKAAELMKGSDSVSAPRSSARAQ